MNICNMVELSVHLIEPSPTQSKIIIKHLQDLGIAGISQSKTGAEALLEMKQNPVNLAICAMYLPDMTGTDLVYAMRDDPAMRDAGFILISSETNPHYLDPIRQAGTIAILPKPFTEQQLHRALASTLDYLDPKALRLNIDDIDLEHINVLIVDDSLTARNFIRHILGNLGVSKFAEASNGKEAIALIEQQFFDLIVTDYHMPEMDGKELTEHIRNKSGQGSVPILMVSSERNANRLAAVESAGVSALCDKPFDPRLVRDLVTKLLANH